MALFPFIEIGTLLYLQNLIELYVKFSNCDLTNILSI